MNDEPKQYDATFGGLFACEGDVITRARDEGKTSTNSNQKPVVTHSRTVGASRGDPTEPWVSFSESDRVGLAFSGGGIRSATFNLGLLQGLHDLRLLPLFDYLATVSGGGYIGAWWTAWRSRRGSHDERQFPAVDGAAAGAVATAEPDEIRHLRRFSNYLVPRFGFLEVEFWNGVVAVLNGLIPGLAIATSMITLAIWGWMVIGWLLLGAGPQTSEWAHGVLAVLVFFGGELWWRAASPKATAATENSKSVATYAVLSAVAVLGIVGLRALLRSYDAWLRPMPTSESPVAFFEALSLKEPTQIFNLFLPSGIFALVGVGLILLRFIGLVAHSSHIRTHATDVVLRRVLGRLAFMALAWSIPAAIWWLASILRESTHLILATGGIGGIAAATFSWLRTWIVRAMQPGRQPGFAKKLRALLPQVLAYVALFCSFAMVCIVVQATFANPVLTALSYAVPIITLICALLWFDPVNCGMHAYYRDRLSRAYLGASIKEEDLPRSVNEQLTDAHPKDDILLSTIRQAQTSSLPLHLVCCAANELDADPLSNFARGARSAVLSSQGFSIANGWQQNTDLTLGSAITASAAAFNSNMGSVSKHLGGAVTFLMCALNLRLGLWATRPGARHSHSWLKGWPFFFEMFGLTSRSKVHLSDGGHFENLALYELVRRHCRYIVLSDVGADPEVAFDDLGNAVRRIREDFGVDIEIDVEPLKPNTNGLARQHMVVGAIHYDHSTGDGRIDKGILLYFKPNLTGDEPVDVRQYRSRNQEFPNESTVDQFYDEAQWEAYRRLGQHAARAALGFVEGLPSNGRSSPLPDDVFIGARWKWYPTAPELPANMTALTSRFVAFEGHLQATAPLQLVREIYPEVAGQLQTAEWPDDVMFKAIHLLVQMLQLMEDAYISCQLEEHWNHPLNSGWMNWFRRWTGAPIFRSWWPLLKGMYSDGFRDFVEGRLGVTDKISLVISDRIANWNAVPEGLAKAYAAASQRPPIDAVFWTGTYALPSRDMQLCLLCVDENDKTWQWSFRDLMLLPQLGATGTATLFLEGVIRKISQLPTADRPDYLMVVREPVRRGNLRMATVAAAPGARDSLFTPAQRAEWNDDISMYKQLGFVEQPNGSMLFTVSD